MLPSLLPSCHCCEKVYQRWACWHHDVDSVKECPGTTGFWSRSNSTSSVARPSPKGGDDNDGDDGDGDGGGDGDGDGDGGDDGYPRPSPFFLPIVLLH